MPLLFIRQWVSDEVLKATGWTLVHSLWQGLLAALIAGAIIIATRRSPARVRYNLLAIVLVLFVTTSIITFVLELSGPVTEGKTIGKATGPVTEIYFSVSDHVTNVTSTPATMDKFVDFFNKNADFFVLTWALFFLVHCIKLVGGLASVRRLRTYRTHLSGDWLEKLAQLRHQIGIRRAVNLLQSELVKVPVAIGIFKPVILVPLGLLSNLPPEQVETILLHELAHIRRNDYLVNILQRFTEAVFFFNPALLWISALLRQEREACCDDVVVANTDHKGNYLEALISFQEYSLARRGYAMAISSKKFYLLNRVKRMITLENKKLNVMEKIVLIAGLIAFTAFNFIPKKEKSDPGRDAVQLSRSVIPVLDEKPITPIPRVGHAKTTKHVVVKENPIANEFSRQPMLEVTLVTPPIDTVPEKGKKKTGYDQLTFPSISSSTNDDGKKKTQSVTVTDQSGKKYSYKKENDKLTSLIVDGKTIPESEYGNYSPLLDKIEQTMQENRAKRMEQMQLRKVERVMRVQDQRNRIAQSNLIRQYQNAQRQYQNTQRQYERQQEMQYKLMERSRKSSEDQKREMMRLMNRLKQRQMKPMLNGREVIKVDPPVELLKDQNVLIKADINSINQSAMVAQPVNNRMKVALVEPVILKRAERPILQNRSVSVKPTMSTIPLRRKVVI